MYFKSWSIKGVNYISDLIHDKHWMPYIDFKKKYDIDCNVLKYLGLINVISKHYKGYLTKCKQSQTPKVLIDLDNAVKGSQFAYKLLNQSNITPTAQHKWVEEFGSVTDNKINWNEVYSLPYKCTIDAHSHYFQYRFIHRILPTNVFLFKIGIVESDKCTFCKDEKETVKHLMWLCVSASSFWKEVIKWLNDLKFQIIISYINVCLGYYEVSNINFINMIIILAKKLFFIYYLKF